MQHKYSAMRIYVYSDVSPHAPPEAVVHCHHQKIDTPHTPDVLKLTGRERDTAPCYSLSDVCLASLTHSERA